MGRTEEMSRRMKGEKERGGQWGATGLVYRKVVRLTSLGAVLLRGN